MNIIKHIYYVVQVVFSACLVIGALYMTLHGIFTGEYLFVNICFAIMTYTTYCLMYAPSMREYREFKSRCKKTKIEQK